MFSHFRQKLIGGSCRRREDIIRRGFASPGVDFKFIRVCPVNHQE